MGISLNGLTPANTYPGLIKTGDNTAISGTPKVLSDGNGNNLPMEVSTTGVNFTNNLTQGGTALQPVLVSGTNIKTINGASVLGSGDIVTPFTPPSGVAGAIQFSTGSAFGSDAANLFWDDTNNRLGVGTNTPTGRTQITESFTTIANNYSAITFDGTITSRATASDTIFGFRNTQSIVATATGQTIIANDLTPNYNFFDANTDSVALRIGGLKNTQNNQSAILMQQTATAGNNGLAIQPANSRWQIGYCAGQSNQISSARVVYGQSGIRIATSSAPANNLFEIIGTGSTSATTSLLVQNSAGAASLQVTDDGSVYNLGKNAIASNTAFGRLALIANTTGTGNTAMGQSSLNANNTGVFNTAFGFSTMYSNQNGTSNVAVGYEAAFSNVFSSGITAIGYQSLRQAGGANNTAIGHSSLFNNSGANNTAVGYESARANSSSTGVTAIGYQSLLLSTGENNTALGFQAGDNITTGAGNVCIGSGAKPLSATANNQFVVGSSTINAGSVVTESNSSTKVWNVIINGVAQKILLA
jgi:hypothetical protein